MAFHDVSSLETDGKNDANKASFGIIVENIITEANVAEVVIWKEL